MGRSHGSASRPLSPSLPHDSHERTSCAPGRTSCEGAAGCPVAHVTVKSSRRTVGRVRQTRVRTALPGPVLADGRRGPARGRGGGNGWGEPAVPRRGRSCPAGRSRRTTRRADGAPCQAIDLTQLPVELAPTRQDAGQLLLAEPTADLVPTREGLAHFFLFDSFGDFWSQRVDCRIDDVPADVVDAFGRGRVGEYRQRRCARLDRTRSNCGSRRCRRCARRSVEPGWCASSSQDLRSIRACRPAG